MNVGELLEFLQEEIGALLPTGVELINPEAKQWEESFKEHAV